MARYNFGGNFGFSVFEEKVNGLEKK